MLYPAATPKAIMRTFVIDSSRLFKFVPYTPSIGAISIESSNQIADKSRKPYGPLRTGNSGNAFA
jgi:hypothetical protein